MKSLINGESLKELRTLDKEFSASIITRLNAAGVMLDDVLWVYDTLLNRSNYAEPYPKNSSVRLLARLNKVPVIRRLAALQNVLSDLWRDYAQGYDEILAQGVLCTTQGAWDVFKSLRKKFRSGKPFAFTISNLRLESSSEGAILLKYGKGLTKSLRFVRYGNRYLVSYDRLVCVPAHLNTSTGKVECKKKGLFKDVLSILQAPIWEPEELPTHVCFEMLPTAFIVSVLALPLDSTPDELGADKLFDLCRTARRAANGNA